MLCIIRGSRCVKARWIIFYSHVIIIIIPVLLENAKDTTHTGTHPTPTLVEATASTSDSPSLTGWMIAVIVIVSTLLLVALGALVFFGCIRQRNRNDQHEASASVPVSSPSQPAISSNLMGEDQTTLAQEKGISATGVSTPAIPRPFSAHDLSSINSLTPITGPRGGGAVSPQSTNTPQNTSEIQQQQQATIDPRQSSSVLSSTDAIMIADTFRQFMRKPEWKNNHERPEEEEEDDDDDDENTFKQLDENEQRKRLGDELLRKELAEEGTSVYQIERRSGRYNSKNQDE